MPRNTVRGFNEASMPGEEETYLQSNHQESHPGKAVNCTVENREPELRRKASTKTGGRGSPHIGHSENCNNE